MPMLRLRQAKRSHRPSRVLRSEKVLFFNVPVLTGKLTDRNMQTFFATAQLKIYSYPERGKCGGKCGAKSPSVSRTSTVIERFINTRIYEAFTHKPLALYNAL